MRQRDATLRAASAQFWESRRSRIDGDTDLPAEMRAIS